MSKLSGELTDLARKLPVEIKELEESVRFDDPKSLVRLLDQVQPLLVSRLLDNGVVGPR